MSQGPIAVAIKTADRRLRSPYNYLAATLANLARGGIWRSRLLHSLHVVDTGDGAPGWPDSELVGHVVVEGAVTAPFFDDDRRLRPVYVWRPPARRTLHQNAATAIRVAASAGAPWALVLEDDVDVCARFLESVYRWLTEHARSDRRLYAFGAHYPQIAQAAAAGASAWDYPIEKFYGAQAVAWSRADATDVAAWLGDDPQHEGSRERRHDLLLQDWGRARGLAHFLASAPSFVQHVGWRSGINNRFFEFETWPGRSWFYGRREVEVGEEVGA